MPTVLGQIAAGILIGPTMFGWVESGPLIREVANIGVILLMFLAGLETNTALLRTVLSSAFSVATLGVTVPLASGYGIGLWLGYSPAVSLILGTILVATSVSITVQVLREMNKLQTLEGTTILGAAVIDDILGFLLLSIVLALVSASPEAMSPVHVNVLLLKMLLFVTLLWIGSKLAESALDVLERLGGQLFVIIGLILLAFGFSWAAEYFGLAGIVGAYLIGVLLRVSVPDRFPQGNRYASSLETIGYALFIPIFFAAIGLNADFKQLTPSMIGMSAILSLIAIFSKIVGCGTGALLTGMDRLTSLRIGCGMVARGEVGLIIALTAFQMQLIGQELFSTALLVVMITTLMTPFLLNATFSRPSKKSVSLPPKT